MDVLVVLHEFVVLNAKSLLLIGEYDGIVCGLLELVVIHVVWTLEPSVLFDDIRIKPLPLFNWIELVGILPEHLPHGSKKQRIPEVENVHADQTQIYEVEY